jgi:hypothetical protein
MFKDRADSEPSYMVGLERRNGRVSCIRDCRYVRYVTADAELRLLPETNFTDDSESAAR